MVVGGHLLGGQGGVRVEVEGVEEGGQGTRVGRGKGGKGGKMEEGGVCTKNAGDGGRRSLARGQGGVGGAVEAVGGGGDKSREGEGSDGRKDGGGGVGRGGGSSLVSSRLAVGDRTSLVHAVF